MFLSSGLYRRYGGRTHSCLAARGLVALLLITSGEEFHLALKQIFFTYKYYQYKYYMSTNIHTFVVKTYDFAGTSLLNPFQTVPTPQYIGAAAYASYPLWSPARR